MLVIMALFLWIFIDLTLFHVCLEMYDGTTTLLILMRILTGETTYILSNITPSSYRWSQ